MINKEKQIYDRLAGAIGAGLPGDMPESLNAGLL